MSSSEFGVSGVVRDEGNWIPVHTIASGRYALFKVRLNGMLHFVKRPSPEFENDLLTLESLRKEFAIAYPLNHPSVARYLRFENDAIYEEFVDGITLRDLIEANDPRLKDSRFLDRVGRELFEALDYIHSEGVTHLDIKPENLMITRMGNHLKIIDFSCAKSAMLDATPGFTPEYMAPEQKEGETGIETDIYLAGVTLQRLADAAGDTRRWRKFLKKATAIHPAERFHSASEAISSLPSGKRQLRSILAIGACALVVIILIFSIFIRNNSASSPTEIAVPEKDSAFNPEVAPTPATSEPTATYNNSSAAQPAALEATLSKEIGVFVKGYYQREVVPVCQIPGYDADGNLILGRSEKIVAAISEAKKICGQYGEGLIAKYPDKESFISSTLKEAMNNEQLHLVPVIEKYDKMNQPLREQIKSDPSKPEWQKDLELSEIE